MRTLKKMLAGGAAVGTVLTIAAAATPNFSNPVFASSATKATSATVTASYDAPEGGNTLVTASCALILPIA